MPKCMTPRPAASPPCGSPTSSGIPRSLPSTRPRRLALVALLRSLVEGESSASTAGAWSRGRATARWPSSRARTPRSGPRSRSRSGSRRQAESIVPGARLRVGIHVRRGRSRSGRGPVRGRGQHRGPAPAERGAGAGRGQRGRVAAAPPAVPTPVHAAGRAAPEGARRADPGVPGRGGRVDASRGATDTAAPREFPARGPHSSAWRSSRSWSWLSSPATGAPMASASCRGRRVRAPRPIRPSRPPRWPCSRSTTCGSDPQSGYFAERPDRRAHRLARTARAAPGHRSLSVPRDEGAERGRARGGRGTRRRRGPRGKRPEDGGAGAGGGPAGRHGNRLSALVGDLRPRVR